MTKNQIEDITICEALHIGKDWDSHKVKFGMEEPPVRIEVYHIPSAPQEWYFSVHITKWGEPANASGEKTSSPPKKVSSQAEVLIAIKHYLTVHYLKE